MSKRLLNLVGDSWIPQSGAKHVIVNPADGITPEFELAYSTDDDVRKAVTAAYNAFESWRNTPIVKRCRIIFHCKELLELLPQA